MRPVHGGGCVISSAMSASRAAPGSAYGWDMSDQPKQGYDNYGMWAAGFGIGIGIGVAIGAAMGNIAAGIAIGAGIGVALGVAFQGMQKPKR